MALIYDWGFFVLLDKEKEFSQWLAAHEAELYEHSPPSYEYLGTYRPLWGTPTCDYHQLWKYRTERTLDTQTEYPPDTRVMSLVGGPYTFTELSRQYLSFVDESRAGKETFRLYRSVTDLTNLG